MSNLTFSAEVILSRFQALNPKAGAILGEAEFISFVGGQEGLQKGMKDLIAKGYATEIEGKKLQLTEAGAAQMHS